MAVLPLIRMDRIGSTAPYRPGRRYDIADADVALLQAPDAPKMRILTLYLDGDPKYLRQRIGLTTSTQCEWDYVADAFADACGCEPEEIQIEGTDQGDRVTMRGQIVGRIERRIA